MERIPVPPLHHMPPTQGPHGHQVPQVHQGAQVHQSAQPMMSGALPHPRMGGGQPQQHAARPMMNGMGGGQPFQGMPDILGRFNNMNFGGGQPPKAAPEKEKEKPKPSPPSAKAGTIVSYEGYTFDRLDGWEVASKRVIRVSEEDLQRQVVAKKNQGTIIDQMRKMSAGRRAQIDRLIEEKKFDEKEPQWYEWTPIALQDGKSRTIKKGGRDVKEVLSMDVFIVRKVKQGIPGQKSEPKKDNKPSKTAVLGGTIVDLKQPIKPKEPPKPKDAPPPNGGNGKPADHLGGMPQLPNLNHFGQGGGMFGRSEGGQQPMFGAQGAGFPGMMGGNAGRQPGAAGRAAGQPGAAFAGQGGGQGGFVPVGGRPQGGQKNQPDVQIIQDGGKAAGDGRKRRQSSHGRPDPFAAEIPKLNLKDDPVVKLDGGGSKFIPEGDSSFEEDDDFSPFDEDELSSTTSFSVEYEKPVPRRGSLKLSRHRSKGGEGPIYREHKREKNYREPHRRRESRYEGETFDMFTERSRRPPLGRRSTVAYPSGPRRITNGESPPLSPIGHSPMGRRPSGLVYPDEYDRYRAKERDAEEYFRRSAEEDYKRRQRELFALERERQRRDELDRLDMLDRISHRSDPLGRYRFRD